ncbi:glycosyltransferase [Leptolyngbya boryana]|uniref:glycosyltransferase n=1 Tax=Leptolyngbya boryana TaxID=1184 RepID=UPI0003A351C0|nr:glycosyltransferase [Leptolyngbya boryana]
MAHPVLLLFDLKATGHHSVYINHLVQYWHHTQIPGKLCVVVSQQFVDRHSDVVALSMQSEQSEIEFTAISEAEYAAFQQAKSAVAKSWIEWKLFCQYARQLKATEGVLMYLDSLQLPLCWGEVPPCPISGIYFRPAFHYGKLLEQQQSWKERIRQWRQRLILAQILRNRHLKTLFCLDPFAIAEIQKLHPNTQAKILPLADPVRIEPTNVIVRSQFKQELDIEVGRQVFLMFGELNDRKGIFPVLQALQQVPTEIAQKVCLLLAGPINADQRSRIESAIASVEATPVQVILRDRYLKGQEVQLCFETADRVFATYQRHVGMSSVLAHAAATQTPVIASNYGLLGALTRQYELGITIDATDPAQISSAIAQSIEGAISVNAAKTEQFLQQNQAERFVKTILDNLLDRSQV